MSAIINKSPKIKTDRCCNPFSQEGHIGKDLRSISKNVLKKFPNLPVSAKMCSQCRKEFASHQSQNSIDEVQLEESESDCNESPFKQNCVSREDQLEEMLNGLKSKFASLDKSDPLRLAILTIAPECWSIRQLASEFNISRRMAKSAKTLRQLEGVLASPTSKSGKMLNKDTVMKVEQFYQDDINSKLMPHKSEAVTIVVDGEKQKVQKRLLLSDIKSLHVEFKKLNPEHPIGLTKFSELRPKWCILAGPKGTHTVCVCTIHENFKNLFDAANLKKNTSDSNQPLTDYKDCFSMMVCRATKDICYLGDCRSCPTIESLTNYITEVLEKRGITEVICSLWQCTDRSTLIKQCLSVDEFLTEFTTRLKILIPHHFISKNQSKYIADRKSNLNNDEVLIHTDFSENFSYVVQNAAQQFHYNNDQATIHPVVIYYKNGEEIICNSHVLISDSTDHDTTAVYVMQTILIPEVKRIKPNVKKAIYVSDGAKQHYMNKYQMSNLVNHKNDFGIEAEWHRYATAHGKAPPDGVGASFKREATRASLQAKPNEAILDSKALFTWAKNKFKNLHIHYYSNKDHERAKRHLRKRFAEAPKVELIQSAHGFLVSGKTLNIYRYSGNLNPINSIYY